MFLLKPIQMVSQVAQSYMADYDHLDVVRATINGNSSSRWSISPPSKVALISDLKGDAVMSLKFEWDFKRSLKRFSDFAKFFGLIPIKTSFGTANLSRITIICRWKSITL